MNKETAHDKVQSYLDSFQDPNRRIVLPEYTKILEDGWLVYFDSEMFVRTGDSDYFIAGNLPFFVDHNGIMYPTRRNSKAKTYVPFLDHPINFDLPKE